MDDFHKNLKNRGNGARDWINTFTEVEYLGGNKFGASVTSGHRVFFDKADNNKPKKHKLTDDRPMKDYVLVQSAKCCIEIYPYYAKYYDVNHEEVRLYEERWVIQRLFSEPDDWRDVGAYNPVIAVEDTDIGITVTITYDTDYGTLVVKYIQRDGCALKHDVVFTNTSGSTETFRILQRWAGIVGDKCNGKDVPLVEDASYFAFHSADKTKKIFNISENLWNMIFNPDRTKKTEHCLQLPISISTHPKGLKSDFIYGDWVLAKGENLTVDPNTATFDDPTIDAYVIWDGNAYSVWEGDEFLWFGGYGYNIPPPTWVVDARAYIEWDISSLAGKTLTANPVFKYDGWTPDGTTDEEINPFTEKQPTGGGISSGEIYGYIATGPAYVDPWDFQIGTNKSVDLGTSAKSDLQDAMDISQSWFAIGFLSPDDEGADSSKASRVKSEDAVPAPPVDPPPTLYVEYGEAPVGPGHGMGMSMGLGFGGPTSATLTAKVPHLDPGIGMRRHPRSRVH